MKTSSIVCIELGGLALLASGCGAIKAGSGTNTPVPSGTIVSQGSFTSENGKTVTGTAEVYDQGGGSCVLRLDGISVPTVTGQVVMLIDGNGNTDVDSALQGYTGSQNYYFSCATDSFTQVKIFYTPGNEAYGIALLQST